MSYEFRDEFGDGSSKGLLAGSYADRLPAGVFDQVKWGDPGRVICRPVACRFV